MGLDLADVRRLAREETSSEIFFNEKSLVVSFLKQGLDDRVRINVYWTTGTVGTCLNHPRQKYTQLFRRDVDLATLRQIFRNPRVHTGAGYHRKDQQPQPSKQKSSKRRRLTFSVGDRAHVMGYADCTILSDVRTSGSYAGKINVEYDDGQSYHVMPKQLTNIRSQKRKTYDEGDDMPTMDEETEAKAKMKRLEAEAKAIEAEIAQVQAVLDEIAKKHCLKALEEAKERKRLAKIAEQRRIREREQERARKEEEKQRKIGEKRCARGKHVKLWLCHSSFVDEHFDEKVTCISCGGDSTIMLFEGGGSSWTEGLTTPLYNKLNGRQKLLPGPEYVAIGSRGRYYVRFKGGSSQWYGCEEMCKTLRTDNREVKTIAFGEDWNSYCIVFSGGGYEYVAVPSELDKLLQQRDKTDLECVSLGPKGEYFISAENGKAWWGGMTNKGLKSIRSVKDGIKFIDFGDDDSYLCRYT
mmetsp:Transcript_36919/g.110599  ORF Transcript_36919/g.110599 Transcript_36919/m.110599 type:complete len:468 (-) Transcript_36919:97-1500(-)